MKELPRATTSILGRLGIRDSRNFLLEKRRKGELIATHQYIMRAAYRFLRVLGTRIRRRSGIRWTKSGCEEITEGLLGFPNTLGDWEESFHKHKKAIEYSPDLE